LNAQRSPLWHSLTPGPYSIGFRVDWKSDFSRTWGQSDMVKESYTLQKPYGRPVRISTWYPAKKSVAPKMKMKEYLFITAHDPLTKKAQAIIMDKDIGDRSRSIKGLFSGDENEYEKFLNTMSGAIQNATVANGKKFPLLVYSLGQNDYTFENIILFEYLASKGFVVIAVPHLGVNARKDYLLIDEPLSFETQVRDMEFAMSESLKLPFVDGDKIGAFGMSFGSIYSLLLAGRNSNIKALVGLDGTVMSKIEGFAYKYWQSPFYDSCNVKMPVLQLFKKDQKDMSAMNSLTFSDRYLVEFDELVHADFTSYPMYTLHTDRQLLDSFALARRTPEYAAKMHQKICEYVSLFFDATLNNKPGILQMNNAFQNGAGDKMNTQVIRGVHGPNEEEFSKIILGQGIDSAIILYNKLNSDHPGISWLRRSRINRIGYEMIYNNKTEEAIKIFQFNVAVFPESASVYDSLGEGYMIAGNKKLAIANYERSLELDPNNEGAKKAVGILKSGK
jgi:dienelactone hydrolase